MPLIAGQLSYHADCKSRINFGVAFPLDKACICCTDTFKGRGRYTLEIMICINRIILIRYESNDERCHVRSRFDLALATVVGAILGWTSPSTFRGPDPAMCRRPKREGLKRHGKAQQPGPRWRDDAVGLRPLSETDADALP